MCTHVLTSYNSKLYYLDRLNPSTKDDLNNIWLTYKNSPEFVQKDK